MKLSELFDGQRRELMPGVDFRQNPERLEIMGFEDAEEEEPLLAYETPSRVPNYVDGNGSLGPDDASAWGLLAVSMSALCRILDGKREQYQHNDYENKGRDLVGSRYTFRYEAAEDGWTGERL